MGYAINENNRIHCRSFKQRSLIQAIGYASDKKAKRLNRYEKQQKNTIKIWLKGQGEATVIPEPRIPDHPIGISTQCEVALWDLKPLKVGLSSWIQGYKGNQYPRHLLMINKKGRYMVFCNTDQSQENIENRYENLQRKNDIRGVKQRKCT